MIVEFPETPRLLEASHEVVPYQGTGPEISEIDPEELLFEKIIELETSLENQRAISLGTDLIVGAALDDITEVKTTLKQIQDEFPECVSLVLRLAREVAIEREMCNSLDGLISIQTQKEEIELYVSENGRANPHEVLRELRKEKISASNQEVRDFIDQKIKEQLQFLQKLSNIWTGSLSTMKMSDPIAPVAKAKLATIQEAWLEGDADEVSSGQSSREPSFLESVSEEEEPVEAVEEPIRLQVLEADAEPIYSWKIETPASTGTWGKVESLMDWTASKVSATLARLPKWIYEPLDP